MSPRAGEHGDQAHLTWGTLRWSVARQMRLAAEMAGGSEQYAMVVSCVDVLLTREQVASFVPPDRRPDELERYALWLLRGDDELIAVERN